MEAIARSVLDFADHWEYGRYLELLHHLGAHDKVSAMVAEGLKSADADVRDMAELWAAPAVRPSNNYRESAGISTSYRRRRLLLLRFPTHGK